ncbi:class I SAM-dependent methyltransferase [Ferrovibrio xuzhouensis]|uniref:Class I SAM-dependent methyltransferase n=1 Tax=Ferrovibrio xuzhouensis TaxID=1576914 RepID=A0ABV7VKI9_9PROT
MTDSTSTDGYTAEADVLAERYERIRFEDVHAAILHLLPATPCRAIDIGAGTGRDAAALAARGHAVTAVEPTAAMRAHGQRLHPGSGITWIDDGLPDLARVEGTFDLVMLTAVWMHLDAGERARGMARLAALLAPQGLAAMTLRHGPVPPGRRMFEVSGAETVALAAPHGLQAVLQAQRGDMHGREVTWTQLVLRRV